MNNNKWKTKMPKILTLLKIATSFNYHEFVSNRMAIGPLNTLNANSLSSVSISYSSESTQWERWI